MFREIFQRFKLGAIDRSSLQFRLTLEIAMLSVLSLGSVAAWTSWKMQDILITTHTQNVKYIATRFPRDVELYSDMLPLNVGLQKTIDNVSVPNLVIWVKSADSKQLLAQSNGANVSFMADNELMKLAEMPLQPMVYQFRDRFLVLHQDAVWVKGNLLGNVYMAKDVTEEERDRKSVV